MSKTNDQWVKHVMNYCPTGALGQAFVINAIYQYAKLVAEADAKELDTPLINGQAWKRTAEFMLREYKKNYTED